MARYIIRPLPTVGQKFGRLTVVEITNEKDRGRNRIILCSCDCGGVKRVGRAALTKGLVKSCGCMGGLATHGYATKKKGIRKQNGYGIWIGIIGRCFNPKATGFSRYGGIGITMCNRWRHSFEAFISDMGPRPSLNHSVDRFPNRDGNYEPGNCRWATAGEQSRNRNSFGTFHVKKLALAYASELL